MTCVLVTGANGHVGANVVRSLLRRGYDVVAFVRRTSDLRGLAGLDVTYRYGDVMDAASFSAAAQDCDVIVHMAAVYRFWTKNPNDITQPSLAGTRNLFAAAQQAGVRRIVYTSSTFAVGATNNPNTVRTADDWNTEVHMPYTVAKTRSEQEAWRLAGEMSIPMIALCPDGILGPYDYAITPSTGILLGLLNGTGQTFNSGISFVDARDVAEVHALAVDSVAPGQRYIVAGENMPMKKFGAIVTELTGVRPRHVGAGRRTMLAVAGVMEVGAKLIGSEPALTRDMARELAERYHYYDCKKTWQTFGLTPKLSEEMISDAIRWLLYIGKVKPALAQRLAGTFPPHDAWLEREKSVADTTSPHNQRQV